MAPVARPRRSVLTLLAVVAAVACLVALGRWAPDGLPRSPAGPAAGRGAARAVPPGFARVTGTVLADLPTRGAGADISWPECRRSEGIPGKRGQGKPMPPRTSRFVVLGLTNGPAFHANPCLAAQVAWVRRHRIPAAAYAVTTYPFPREVRRLGSAGPFPARSRAGRLANVGYQQARFNLATMRGVGLPSPAVWIDVEDSSLRVWPRRPGTNRAVLRGLLRGYRESGLRVGVYSTPYLWGQVLGGARYGLPEWRSAGPTSARAARARCSSGSFQGGPAVLVQWWVPRKDYDLVCPGGSPPTVLRRWFHRW